MKNSLREKLDQISHRLQEIDNLLASENAVDDLDFFRKLSRERADIEPIVTAYCEYSQCETDLAHARDMLADPEMRELAKEEIDAGSERLARIELELQKMLLPKDPNDERNIFLEIRAGTGGDESAIFAGDLLRMYARYAENKRWRVEIISESPSELGGYREIVALIAGAGAYSRLKFESGAHRVQRVPETEAQGRIHTSTCTIAVLPEVDKITDVDINPADLKIDTYRASGAGGQHVNKTNSAIRITHLPSGIVVECQEDRSQHRNRAQAMAVLAARLKNAQEQERQRSITSERKSLVGTGERSERIRTYNFPQGRVTDHRINLTLYKIDAIMAGDLDEVLDALAAEYQAEQLAALGK